MRHVDMPQVGPSGLPPGPNRYLSPLNPLKARSTLAVILALAATVLPLLSDDLRDAFGEALTPEGQTRILDAGDRLVAALNEILTIVGLVWFWLERRAPWHRLSFRRS